MAPRLNVVFILVGLTVGLYAGWQIIAPPFVYETNLSQPVLLAYLFVFLAGVILAGVGALREF